MRVIGSVVGTRVYKAKDGKEYVEYIVYDQEAQCLVVVSGYEQPVYEGMPVNWVVSVYRVINGQVIVRYLADKGSE